MTSLVATSPDEYTTNTDEKDALALSVVADLGAGESATSAVCELRRVITREDVTESAFVQSAAVVANLVTQPFDARQLAPGHYEWVWTVTLNTGAVRSYRTLLKVENHD